MRRAGAMPPRSSLIAAAAVIPGRQKPPTAGFAAAAHSVSVRANVKRIMYLEEMCDAGGIRTLFAGSQWRPARQQKACEALGLIDQGNYCGPPRYVLERAWSRFTLSRTHEILHPLGYCSRRRLWSQYRDVYVIVELRCSSWPATVPNLRAKPPRVLLESR